MNNTTPDISVIIATYNRCDVLKRTLIAYDNSTFRSFEVIVSSDGSSDGTDEMMREMRHKLNYPLHYVRQEDIGFRKSMAVNKAIRIAAGQIMVFADDDMIPPPDYLKNYRRCFSGDTEAGTLVYSKYLPVAAADGRFTEENIRNGRYMKRVTLADRIHLFCWKLKYLIYFKKNHPIRPKLNGNNFAVSAAAIRLINGLDLDFTGWGYEDDDVRRRLLAAGTRQKEAVCSAYNFNLGYYKADKTTAGRPELLQNVSYNKKLAYDTGRPVRCLHGLAETEAAEVVF